jgi:hypothetical protein
MNEITSENRNSAKEEYNRDIGSRSNPCSQIFPRSLDGDRFFSRFTEYVTGEHAKHSILALCNEFEEDLIVVLDGTPYFQASAVTDLAARDDLVFVTLPSYSPELNPVEECWRQLQADLSNRFFDSLDELTTVIDTALDKLSVPKVSDYF